MTPSATFSAGALPRGPNTLIQSGTWIGREAVRPPACSIRTGLPSAIAVSPASRRRRAVM